MQEIGFIKNIYRYPIKSMAGECLTAATFGWNGIEGDRRFAFRRIDDAGGFPFLTAGRFPSLLQYQPICKATLPDGHDEATHVINPQGNILELRSDALRQEISEASRTNVELFQLRHGIFDEAMLSLINLATIDEIGRMAGQELDPRRFRPNILLQPTSSRPFQEDEWVGKIIAFGKTEHCPAMSVMQRDERCSMINFDPETALSNPQIFKTVVRVRQNYAGIYGSTLRSGLVSEGDRAYLIEV